MSDEDFAAMWDAMGDVAFETRLALVLLFAAGADEWPQWPPESTADLEAELATSAAARRIGALLLRQAWRGVSHPVTRGPSPAPSPTAA